MKTLYEIWWSNGNVSPYPLVDFMDVFNIDDRSQVVSTDYNLLEKTCQRLRDSTCYEYEIMVKDVRHKRARVIFTD